MDKVCSLPARGIAGTRSRSKSRVRAQETGMQSVFLRVHRSPMLAEDNRQYRRDTRDLLAKVNAVFVATHWDEATSSLKDDGEGTGRAARDGGHWVDEYRIPIPHGQTWGNIARQCAAAQCTDLSPLRRGHVQVVAVGSGSPTLLRIARARRMAAQRKLGNLAAGPDNHIARALPAALLELWGVLPNEYLILDPVPVYDAENGLCPFHAMAPQTAVDYVLAHPNTPVQPFTFPCLADEKAGEEFPRWVRLCRNYVGFAEVFAFVSERAMLPDTNEEEALAWLALLDWIEAQRGTVEGNHTADRARGHDGFKPENIVHPQHEGEHNLPYGEEAQPLPCPHGWSQPGPCPLCHPAPASGMVGDKVAGNDSKPLTARQYLASLKAMRK